MKSRTGLTLMELLAALSLLAAVALAVATWVGAQTRMAWRARQDLGRVAAFIEVVRLLEDDLTLSETMRDTARVRVMEDHRCSIVTRSAAPGDSLGLLPTHWRYDAAQDILWRERGTDPPRIVAQGLGACSFRWLSKTMEIAFSVGTKNAQLVAVVPAEMRP